MFRVTSAVFDESKDIMTSPVAELKPLKRSRSFEILPPDLSELRLVLLGSSWSLRSSVGNLVLGKSEFIKDSPRCVKVRGTFQDKPVTVIYTPDQLISTISQQELQQFIQDIKDLSAPGPHVFLLVLQPEDFTEEHKSRLQSVLENLSEQAFHHSLVLMITHNIMRPTSSIVSYLMPSPRAETPGSMEKYMRETHIRDMIIRCRFRYLWMDHNDLHQSDLDLKEFKRKELFSRIGDMLKENDGDHVSPDPSEEEDTGLTLSCGTKHKPSLNLVLFGSSGAGKTSAAESILGRAELPAASSPGECVKHEGEVCGRRVSLVELPALSGKPLKTVMEQWLRCISLCAPEGVHAFILVLPLGPLTDEDKAELKTIQDTLSSRVLLFTVILFTVDSESTAPAELQFVTGDRDIQELCQSCGGGDLIFNPRDQQKVSELLKSVETLRTKNEPHSFTTETLQQVQIEKICALQEKQQERCDLRITLIGKTGTGKSSSGNTILGREEFYTKLSQRSFTRVCQKAEAVIDGRRVSVVDTPGLFDTTTSCEEGNEEKIRCISLQDPGPHVFLLVLQIGRMTPEEKETLELIKKGFGEEVDRFMIVLLTHGDKLENDDLTVEDYIENESDESFKELISNCGNRFHVFNNRMKEDRTQVKELMKKIDAVVKKNGGECYTSAMLLKAEVDMKTEILKILKEKDRERDEMERKYKEEINKMTNKYEENIKEVINQKSVIEGRLQQNKKQMEDDRTKWENERKSLENLFVEKYEKQIREIEMAFEEEERKQAEEFNLIKEMLQEKKVVENMQIKMTQQLDKILQERQEGSKELKEKKEKIRGNQS